LIVSYQDELYFPFLIAYSETEFGGDFETEADYSDAYVRDLITAGDNWVIDPLIQYSYNTINQFDQYIPVDLYITGCMPRPEVLVAGIMELQKMIKILNDIKEMEAQGRKELQGEKAFRLYDTFGFPIDLTRLLSHPSLF